MPVKLVKPILFSQHFAGSMGPLQASGLFDPVLNSDSKLFVDPLLLSASENPFMSAAYRALRDHLEKVIRLITASQAFNDAAWKAAAKLLSLKEIPETCLGYGGSSTSGSSRSAEIVHKILLTTKEIVTLGESDPEIISLMGMFEEGVGPDTISDLTTNAILPELYQLTEDFCLKYGLRTRAFADRKNRHLPENPYKPSLPVLLVPKDILRELPLAADWSGVSRVTFENEQIRETFNRLVGAIAQVTVSERKEALKRTALESLSNFKAIFDAVIGSSDSYDPNADPLNLYRFREIIGGSLDAFRKPGLIIGPPGPDELKALVRYIIEHFRQLVETNNLWELIWEGNKPKRERASQLLFFAVAEAFCRANNIDISPETNPGGGPVDFRFSVGYHNRVLVEIKLSKGKVVHGYKTQLSIYQSASNTDLAIFLIMDVGNLRYKLKEIESYRNAEITSSRLAPDIMVVDARRRRSASVREAPLAVIDDEVDDEDET